MAARKKPSKAPAAPQAYSHPESTSPARPEIGAQAHFKKTKAPAKYRYDSSLAPELVWDEGNPAREDAEKLIAELALQAASKERDAEEKPLEKEIRETKRQLGIPAFYLQATMDLQMGDLLKNMRSSHVFSVCGLPDVKVSKAKPGPNKSERWEVELQGLETFDPVTMEADAVSGKEVPACVLETDYNGMVFKVRQAFFPRTGPWEKLKKSLKVEFEEGVWDHLAGTTSAPFEPGDNRRIAVKVIDPRGNELIAVKKLEVTK